MKLRDDFKIGEKILIHMEVVKIEETKEGKQFFLRPAITTPLELDPIWSMIKVKAVEVESNG